MRENEYEATTRVDVPGIGPRRVPPVQPDQGRGALQEGARKEGIMQGPQGDTMSGSLFLSMSS